MRMREETAEGTVIEPVFGLPKRHVVVCPRIVPTLKGSEMHT